MNRSKTAEKEEFAAVFISTVCFRQNFLSSSNKAGAYQSGGETPPKAQTTNNQPHKKSQQIISPASYSIQHVLSFNSAGEHLLVLLQTILDVFQSSSFLLLIQSILH